MFFSSFTFFPPFLRSLTLHNRHRLFLSFFFSFFLASAAAHAWPAPHYTLSPRKKIQAPPPPEDYPPHWATPPGPQFPVGHSAQSAAAVAVLAPAFSFRWPPRPSCGCFCENPLEEQPPPHSG